MDDNKTIHYQTGAPKNELPEKKKNWPWVLALSLAILLVIFFLWWFFADFSGEVSTEKTATTTQNEQVASSSEDVSNDVLGRTYTNKRFDYRLKLPELFTNVNRSQNSDGASFTNDAQTARLDVYASNNVLDKSIENIIENAKEDFSSVRAVNKQKNEATIIGVGQNGKTRREYMSIANENIYRIKLSYSGDTFSDETTESMIDSFKLLENR